MGYIRYSTKRPDVYGPDYDWCISKDEAERTLEEMAADVLDRCVNPYEASASRGFQSLIFAITALDIASHEKGSEMVNTYYREYFYSILEEIKYIQERRK